MKMKRHQDQTARTSNLLGGRNAGRKPIVGFIRSFDAPATDRRDRDASRADAQAQQVALTAII